jgi:hypothetical protein
LDSSPALQSQDDDNNNNNNYYSATIQRFFQCTRQNDINKGAVTMMTMMRYLLSATTAVVLATGGSVVEAFATQAGGDCLGGQAAVGGLHTQTATASDGGTRKMLDGSLLDNQIGFYVDGTILTDSSADAAAITVVPAGVEHMLEIVASHPFNGALVRIESTTATAGGSSSTTDLTLIPMINAQIATVCQDPAVRGFTQTDNKDKNAMSGAFLTSAQGEFVIDVTVVGYNNATGSVYWYSQFKLNTVLVENTEALKESITSGAPQVESSASPSAVPTFSNLCFVCNGDEFSEVTAVDAMVMFLEMEMTCQDLSDAGRGSYIPPQVCDEAQIIAEVYCGCKDSPLASESVATTAPAPSAADLTMSPTVTAFPTYAQSCNICGEGMRVGAPDANVVVGKEMAVCRELELDGAHGMIPPEDCASVKFAAMEYCNCVKIQTLAPTAASTEQPTTTPPPYPSLSPWPTYGEKCLVCGDESSKVSNVDTMVTVDGVTTSCLVLQSDGLTGVIPPQACPDVQQVASDKCGCALVQEATPTFAPTISAAPTVTPFPTYVDKCLVCGEGFQVMNKELVVEVDGGVGTCAMLEEEGAAGFISQQVCTQAKVAASEICGCEPVSKITAVAYNNALKLQLSPATSPSPTTTPLPTYVQKCTVCKEGYKLSNPEQIIEVDGSKGTCLELEQDGAAGFVAPEVCADAQNMCDCEIIAPTASTETLSPTVTPLPTFDMICNICTQDGWLVTNTAVEITVGQDTGTCQLLQEVALNAMLPPDLCPEAQAAAGAACGCSPPIVPSPSSVTMSPITTPFPTISFMPSYTDGCSVCPDGYRVANLKATVMVDKLSLSCAELEDAGLERMIPSDICDHAKAAAQATCGCDAVKPSSAPPVETFAPTSTAEPTVSPLPTFMKEERCYLCGVESMQIRDPTPLIVVGGMTLSCAELEESAVHRILPPELCQEATQVATKTCGCTAHVSAPSPAPMIPETFVPTITAFPTQTALPTFTSCNVCVNETITISKENDPVVLGGMKFTCGVLAQDGMEGYIPTNLCEAAQVAARASCGCTSQTGLSATNAELLATRSSAQTQLSILSSAFSLLLAMVLP